MSVAPATGRRKTVVRVAFTSRARLGAVSGGRRRTYSLVARRRSGMSGCVQHRDASIDRGRRGQRVTGRIDPARGKGGHLGWCRGGFSGKVRYFDSFACPRSGRCQSPAGFEKLNRVVARFRFRIE
jgi:hypothetical protein